MKASSSLLNRCTGILILCTALIFSQSLNARARRPEARTGSDTGEVSKAENTKTPATKEPVSLSKFIKADSPCQQGLTPVYQQDKKYYISIADSLIGRDMLMVSRIVECAAGFRSNFLGYAGDELQEGVFRFVKGPDHKIFLVKVSMREQTKDSTQAMYRNLSKSNLPAIVEAFDIKAYNEDKTTALIDITNFVKGDNESIYFPKRIKTGMKMGGFQADKSYIQSVKTFPINTELRSVKTYALTARGENATFALNCSWVLLPKVPMQVRYADPRVGYFTSNYIDFDQNPQGIKRVKMIARWRLEPKAEDVEKYLRGELVEPAKPIVYYIDPSTPKKWVPYLIQGVNDWQAAFEKAGFKNAIYAREAPTAEEDPTWSLEDARHSAIVYKASTISNANGPHISDPRSGEILESHVNWYHNVMNLVHNWYMIQCGPVDPQARSMVFPDSLMGQLIRFVSSHEIGHTLGLRHNFNGTACYTLEQIRDTAFLRKNGHSTSIMDYSRFNYVAQPEDSIPQELLFPRIGHYDLWCIEWGYRRFPDITDPQEERNHLSQWVTEKIKNPYLRFGSGREGTPFDPRGQAEDIGENPMISNRWGIKNLQRVIEQLPQWTRDPNEDFMDLRLIHYEVVNTFNRYLGHVINWIGGIYTDHKVGGEEGPVYTFTEKAKAREAMAFLSENAFTTPLWLCPEYCSELLGINPTTTIERVNRKLISAIVTKTKINNLLAAENILGSRAYTVDDFFKDLRTHIFGSFGKTTPYSRNLQTLYINALCKIVKPDPKTKEALFGPMQVSDNLDIQAVVLAELNGLDKKLRKGCSDTRTDAHYKLLSHKIADINK